jgi:SLT domain-containing protein
MAGAMAGGASAGVGGWLNGVVGSIFGTAMGGAPAAALSTASSGTGLTIPASVFSLPARAGGGDVLSSQAYLVGEQGPEVFVPKGAGFIVSNDRLASYERLVTTATKGPAGMWGGSGIASLPARADGGDVYPNQAYLVGERGPEVFISREVGSSNSNQRGGNGSTVIVNNHFAPGTDMRTIDQAAMQIGQRVQRAMRRNF